MLRKLVEDFRPRGLTDDLARSVVVKGEPAELAVKLEQCGVALIPGAVKADDLREAAAILKEFAEQARAADEGTQIDAGIRLAWGSQDYAVLRDGGEPVAIRRGGDDSGMVDIFHVDQFLERKGFGLRRLLENSGVITLVQSVLPQGFELQNINAYVNREVSSTRGFHVDSYGGNQIKAFLYLTDVLTLEAGPYCYVLGSHSQSGFAASNILASKFLNLRSTDVRIFEPSKAVPMLAEAGSLIVSNQSGAHRGLPQGPNNLRVLLALNFQRLS